MALANVKGGGKTDGTMFNLKADSGEKGPDGKTVWRLIGRAFISNDLSSGTLYVGQADTEKKYRLFPRDRKPRPQPQVPRVNQEMTPDIGL